MAHAAARADEVESVIEYREQLIARLNQVVELSSQVEGKMLGIIAREVVNISSDLRDIGIQCVQKIVQWTFRHTPPNSPSPEKYKWSGDQEYLCKMLHDLDFAVEKLPASLRDHGNFATGDPCFVSKHSSNPAQRRAAVGATLVILDAVARDIAYNNAKASMSRRSFSSFHRSKSDLSDSANVSPAVSPSGRSQHQAFHPAPIEKEEVVPRRIAVGDLIDLNEQMLEKEENGIHKVLKPSEVVDISAEWIEDKKKKKQKKEIHVFRGKYLYRRGELIGEGAYAKVYDCDRQDGRRFAVKIFVPSEAEEDDATYEYRRTCLGREVRLLKNMRHPNIIGYEESFVFRKNETYIILEKMACTLMHVNIDRNPQASIKVLDSAMMPHHGTSLQLSAYAVITQLLNAVSYLHAHNVIHRDIKPDNVLATVSPKGFIVKLADFGSARELPTAVESYPDLTNYVGSRCYRAPEVLGQNTSYGMHADVWGVGCTIAEFVTGRPLFNGETEQDVLDSILDYDFNVSVTLKREIESRGLTLQADQSDSGKLPVQSFFSEMTNSKMIKEEFAGSICNKMLCITEMDRLSAKDLLKIFMAMSAEGQHAAPEEIISRHDISNALSRKEISSGSSRKSFGSGSSGRATFRSDGVRGLARHHQLDHALLGEVSTPTHSPKTSSLNLRSNTDSPLNARVRALSVSSNAQSPSSPAV